MGGLRCDGRSDIDRPEGLLAGLVNRLRGEVETRNMQIPDVIIEETPADSPPLTVVHLSLPLALLVCGAIAGEAYAIRRRTQAGTARATGARHRGCGCGPSCTRVGPLASSCCSVIEASKMRPSLGWMSPFSERVEAHIGALLSRPYSSGS
jgi:hypothetical protein